MCRPFESVVREGRLYGRGSADLKGGLAAAFWGLKILTGLGFEPAGDLILESVVDEEFAGGNGTLASRLRGFNADLAVLTEPTRMEKCPACQGALLGTLTLSGKGGMPYMGHEIPNPIRGAARAVQCFYEWQEEWRKRNSHSLFGQFRAFWKRKSAEEPNLAPFSCDLAHHGEAGRMRAVVLGPRGENLHAPDEWVLVEDVLALTGIFALLAAAWCG